MSPDEMADLELAAGFTQAYDDPHCQICQQPIEPCGGNRNCVHVQAGRCVKHMLTELPIWPGDRHPFAEPISGEARTLVIPPGGSLFGSPKIGIEHPRCPALADVSLELDAFYCSRCKATGRVSGAWCSELIEAAL